MQRQPVQQIVGRVHTADYRIHGTLFPRPRVGIPDQLNRNDQNHLPIGDLALYRNVTGDVSDVQPLARGEFMAVPRESLHWVVGGDAGDSTIREFEWRRVAVLYGETLLRGKLRVGPTMRTSDFIRRRIESNPFDALFEVAVNPLEGGTAFDRLTVVERFPFVTVNLRMCTGVVELGGLFGRAETEES
jgi:hypothetical protein